MADRRVVVTGMGAVTPFGVAVDPYWDGLIEGRSGITPISLKGNDGGFLTCLDLKTGDRMWKGGRYGKGQVLLLENAGLLLVAAEDGKVHLVRADPKEFVEVDSFKALEGKTWNHPVVVGDKLYVRNSQAAAGFQLSTAKDAEPARKL